VQFGHALAKAHEILGREKNRQKRLAPAMSQMRLKDEEKPGKGDK
jgi:hypothetical protein